MPEPQTNLAGTEKHMLQVAVEFELLRFVKDIDCYWQKLRQLQYAVVVAVVFRDERSCGAAITVVNARTRRLREAGYSDELARNSHLLVISIPRKSRSRMKSSLLYMLPDLSASSSSFSTVALSISCALLPSRGAGADCVQPMIIYDRLCPIGRGLGLVIFVPEFLNALAALKNSSSSKKKCRRDSFGLDWVRVSFWDIIPYKRTT